MLTFLESIEPFEKMGGYWSFKFGDGYELAIEPLLFGQIYLALYKDGKLTIPYKSWKRISYWNKYRK